MDKTDEAARQEAEVVNAVVCALLGHRWYWDAAEGVNDRELGRVSFVCKRCLALKQMSREEYEDYGIAGYRGTADIRAK